VINYYTSKLGLFTQIATSSFIPGAVNASVAYFADVSGGLAELNQNNKSWQDFQNIFVGGQTLTVKQFDNKKYSNQVGTDGIKTIYNSGYNYTPELYFATNYDTKLYFSYIGNATAGDFQSQNSGTPNYFTSGAASPTYLADPTTGYIYNIYDQEVTDTAGYYTPGVPATKLFPTYSAPYAGVRNFVANLNIPVAVPNSGETVAYTLSIRKNNAVTLKQTTGTFTSNVTPSSTNTGTVSMLPVVVIASGVLASTYTVTGPVNLFASNGNWLGTSAAGSSFTAEYYSSYDYTDYSTVPVSTITVSTGGTFVQAGSIVDSSGLLQTYLLPFGVSNPATPLSSTISATTVPAVNNLTSTLNLNTTTDFYSFDPGDKITFELHQDTIPASKNFTASVSQGSLAVNTGAGTEGSYPYVSSTTSTYIKSLNNISSTGIITLTSSLANFENYQFVPYFVSGGVAYSSSLYTRYGDINTAFSPQKDDKIILRDAAGNVQDLNVYSASIVSGQMEILTVPNILTSWVTTPTNVKEFLLLRRYNDEQNIIMTFNKNPGQTSYGFLIPNTVSPEITNNINTLQAAVQSQLLSNQSLPSIDTINGGTFS
jgi:hypothetical protein